MKILIIGSNKIYSIENFYVKYLRQAGCDIVVFPANALFHDYYAKNFINKVLYRSGLSLISFKINRQLKEVFQSQRFDIVWIFKGMEIYPKTLKWIKTKGIPIANYNPDNPFLFSGRGSGNANITNSLHLYDLHFTYNRSVKSRLEKELHAKTIFLPFGFDVSDELVDEASNQSEILKACFLGNPDVIRSAFITELAQSGIAISVYGNGWNRFVSHSGIEVNDAVYGDDVWRVLRCYRVQLNLMREHNLDSNNMRTFEVPGVGGIMLAPATPEHYDFFQDGKEAFFFQNLEECVSMAQTILNYPLNEALEIRKAARKRSLDSGYHYKDRTATALKSLERLHG